ncbi:MAG: bifunctional (p)ppGpp synthetase/guanosine-3',5'-bis(diphosphate) 3'-pyrophosphohydrolase [Gammaproteobacteria bacterium]|nr:bifunctional (p)ppGpp synthetase/guanosine-3',5'-bis(diphosphate) 3'-pyrophosphohydrolase [Gammaproteobacteria bacterium]MCZ6723917.1 bifunctional (p)ppGpp synthetase/guanosine-3',5'-bis(diphosphate) 3'-pyrophosphohydrolase [Gammaproteobacteria bacterium]MCZ6882472.1 bifunctional (p)ppGpp synthetase/guanosine-3',5'-bis(diphosphate) 3'-pyrophosphohydrolase [Gammaproteobacteria bacterium]
MTNERDQLVESISARINWDDDLARALDYALDVEPVDKSRPRSVDVAKRVLEMGTDRNTLIATLLSDPELQGSLGTVDIKKQFGNKVALLTQGVNRLNTLQDCNQAIFKTPEQAEKLRRLLMAIISDVRVMLIKLCYRVERLKLLKHTSYEERRCIAQETLDIFAPLANRLGMGLIKWEMEDLAFRALEPLAFKKIATLLEQKRSEREVFIQQFTVQLASLLLEQDIRHKLSGRVKHIVSIWRKMQKKNLEFHELFDVRAVRILVDTVADCYAVLGVVHTTWQHIPKEFDDYIANPKENGYRSLHTAVVADAGQIVEVQIRTFEMHEKSEFGVASHWRYKEGVNLDQRMENSISVMRDMLDGSAEDVSDVIAEISTETTSDRVYVFTPKGQVVDIPHGGTPLDFAYTVHSEVGHRCRGAKVNGRIVNLTRQLQTGDEVEILTTRESKPSRDWMNKNLGFIKSAGTRSKVRSWFNHQDFEQNLLDGKALYDRILTKYSIRKANLKQLTGHFKRKDSDQFFVDLGRGLITSAQIIGFLQAEPERADPFKKLKKSELKSAKTREAVSIHGVGNLMTQLGRCCNPVPGDLIIGFITINSGITIHKHNCPNMLALPEEKRQRLIEVEWGQDTQSVYPVEISLTAFQRTGLMQDVSTLLANRKINLLNINSTTNQLEQMVYTRLTIEIHGVDELVSIIDNLGQIPNIQDVKRIA